MLWKRDKLFCEISPFCYAISLKKEILNVKIIYHFYHHVVKAELKRRGFPKDVARKIGEELIKKELLNIPNEKVRERAAQYIENIHLGKRDFRF